MYHSPPKKKPDKENGLSGSQAKKVKLSEELIYLDKKTLRICLRKILMMFT